MGGDESGRSILTETGSNEVVKGRGVSDTRGQVLEIPEVGKGLEDGGGAVGLDLAGDGVNTLVLGVALGSVGGDEPGGETATKTVEVEGVLLAVVGLLSVGQVVGANSQRGSNVVEEATSLVKGDEQEGLVPLGAAAHSVVDLLDEDLAEADVAGGVHGVGVKTAARRVDVRQLGEKTQVGILVEVLKGNNVLAGILVDPVEEERIGVEVAVDAVVVAPRDAALAGQLENTLGLNAVDIEAVVVGAMAGGGTGNSAEAVGVGGLEKKNSLN